MLNMLRQVLRRAFTRADTPHTAGVYAKPGLLLVHSVRTTTAGVGLPGLDVHRIAAPFSAELIGAAARAALDSYQHDVPHPKDWTGVGRDFLAACHARSWKALESDARFCGIELSVEGQIRLSSTRNGGSSGDQRGFQPNGAPDRILSGNVTNSELGLAILDTIENCT